jgi:positive regulator of sigma E activity
MVLPLIGIFVPTWIIFVVIAVLLLAIFNSDVLHIGALILIAVIGWWLYHRFF